MFDKSSTYNMFLTRNTVVNTTNAYDGLSYVLVKLISWFGMLYNTLISTFLSFTNVSIIHLTTLFSNIKFPKFSTTASL